MALRLGLFHILRKALPVLRVSLPPATTLTSVRPRPTHFTRLWSPQLSTMSTSASTNSPMIGIIGMGDMGRMYARRLSEAGHSVVVCDKPGSFDALSAEYTNSPIKVLQDGHAVSRVSDLIIYSVEAAAIDAVVKEYGPSTKVGATVAGQTSVKAPEKVAFERYLPEDADIVSVHSLHGPGVTTEGQPFVIIHHRGPEEKVRMIENVFQSFKSRYVYMSYEEHDEVTANTQACTHAAFLSHKV